MYPVSHPAQDGMGRRILQDKIMKHFLYVHIFRNDQICRHMSALNALRVLKNECNCGTVKTSLYDQCLRATTSAEAECLFH